MRRVLVTGAHGFIGKNLVVRLRETGLFSITEFVRGDDISALPDLLASVDKVVHLAGENRPNDERLFAEVNTGLTEAICAAIRASGRQIPIVLASSAQAVQDNAYGRSKLNAEQAVLELSEQTGNPATIFRLPGVFGKWCRPNYNSVVATFCHNIARGLPIRIDNPETRLRLVYVDDVVTAIIGAIEVSPKGAEHGAVAPDYTITLGELAAQITAFEASRETLVTERVGTGLTRALYSTYLSNLATERFSYDIPQHTDPRGVFVEVMKTPDCGQFSFLSAPPGVTRGGHYHHTKAEKFLVVQGDALFRFRNILTDERFELRVSGDMARVVETIPGWSHDITNVGDQMMIVMLWANEIFDRTRPDTISSGV
ncbi:NAD-dependent epimerase/dehydratase family protein [Devosia sp. WQ 349]|nr:NAD-dependent epimerase/dehydratase family protein [Devosia sp. WQ 349K1]